MVFNDWGVGVPGIMMIAWPDQWYHTSGDRVDKADPTQLKRVVIIGAAAAYTVASADDDMAMRLAGEILSNGTRRLGHQFAMGLQRLNDATADNLTEQYKWARAHVEAAVINEKATLASVLQLADDAGAVGSYVREMQEAIDRVGDVHLQALEQHMTAVAHRLIGSAGQVDLRLTDLERRAAESVPRPTALVKQDGYRGWQAYLQQVSQETRQQFTYERGDIASTSELQLLINGTNSVLDIKKMLDGQNRTTSDLQAIFNYIEILKAAGLVEMD
jgi:hypothetical protein